jgi:hypothetical protein
MLTFLAMTAKSCRYLSIVRAIMLHEGTKTPFGNVPIIGRRHIIDILGL